MEDEKPKHVRRVRYSGKHPKTYSEKYKEQQPEKYADDVAKVMDRGQTPAGMHRSICVDEIMEILKVSPGEIGLDATLGYGGHATEILKRLQPGGKLFAIDVDSVELPKTKARLESLGYNADQLAIRKMNFAEIDQLVYESGLFNFVLADLGVSSMQIDDPKRGFTFKTDGPLDLRLNPASGKSAADYLKTISQEELEEIFLVNSDEPFAGPISKAIIRAISKNISVDTTLKLKKIIFEAILQLQPEHSKDELKKSCQRCFQALRIEVNNEFGVLDQFLFKLPETLAPGARVAILTFHSGEDRRVKKSFQYFFREGIYSEVASEPIRPSAEECFSNPRAKSAKLRWAIKA